MIRLLARFWFLCVFVCVPAWAGTWGVLTYDGARRTTPPYLSSLAGGEQGVGAVRSPSFTIPPNATEYRFFANGWDGQNNKRGLNYFQLCDAETGKELRRASPPGNDFFQPIVWDVRDLAGRRVYLRAVDGLAEGAFAWMGCKDVPLAGGKVTPFKGRHSPEGWMEEVDGELRPLGRPIVRDPKQQVEMDWEEHDRAWGVRWEKWKAGEDAARAQRDLLVRLLGQTFERAERLLADFRNVQAFQADRFIGSASRRVMADTQVRTRQEALPIGGNVYSVLNAEKKNLDALRSRFDALSKRSSVSAASSAEWRRLYLDTRWAARRLAFENPLLKKFNALLFITRYTQQSYADINVNHHAWGSAPGGDICILSPVGPEGKVRRLLNGRLGPGNVKGIDLSWDGKRIVFAYAKSSSEEPPDGWTVRQKTFDLHRTVDLYHLYEVRIDGTGLRQITRGRWSDLNPCYLPDGRIAFESERCGFELNCNEMDKDEPTTNLFAVKADGSNVRQLTVSKDGHWYPRVLPDGRIIYSHWEYHERDWAYMHPLWTVYPDGTFADAYFKQHLNYPVTLTVPRAVPGSHTVMAVGAGHHTLATGSVVLIDPRKGMNSPQAIERLTGPSFWPEYNDGKPAPAPSVPGWKTAPGEGWYTDPYPLSEKYFFASYCDGAMQDETGYALYLLDVYGGKELIYRDPTISSVMPIPLMPRPKPPTLPDTRNAKRSDALCVVADVHDGVPDVPRGTIRYLRIAEPVGWPYGNDKGGQRYEPDAKATGTSWTPIRILGTVPVERDGSAYFRVPANTALYFQALDEDFMEVRRMRSFVSFRPGETRGCVGCHETQAKAPGKLGNWEIGKSGNSEIQTRENLQQFPNFLISQFPNFSPLLALRRPPSVPAPPPWGDVPLSFLRDVQPVLDRHCVRCHSGLRPAKGVDLSGGLTAEHNRAYDTLVPNRTPTLVSVSNKHDDAKVSQPQAFGSHRSRLLQIVRDENHRDVNLSAEDRLRLVTWIDANAVYHDRFIDKRPTSGQPPYNLATDASLWKQIAAIQQRRCASCHGSTSLARSEWIDLWEPSKTLFLSAPLSGGACQPVVFRDANDADYQAMRKLVEEAVNKAWALPRRDLQALDRKRKPQ